MAKSVSMAKPRRQDVGLPLLGVANYWAVLMLPFMLLFFATNSIVASIYVVFPLSLVCHIILASAGQVRAKFGAPLLALLAFGFVMLLLDRSTFVASYDDYYIWPLLMLASWPLLFFMRESEDLPLGNHVISGFLIFACLAPFFQNENQITALFGANILYRIALLWFGLIAWGCIKRRYWSGFALISAITLWLVIIIDSRAGQLLYAGMLSVFLLNIFAPKLRSFVVPVSILIALISIVNLQQVFALLGELGINLSIYNASEAFRLLMIQELMSPRIIFSDNYTISDLYTIYGSYPHSILVEAFAYHGPAFGLFMSVVMIYLLAKIIGQPKYLFLLGIVAGPLFSGDMRDNFPILIAVFYFALIAFQDRQTKREQNALGRRLKRRRTYASKPKTGVKKSL